MMPGAPPRVVLVDMDVDRRSRLAESIATISTVEVCDEFHLGRRRLEARPDFLVAALRLGAFNGVHLALLARHLRDSTHAVVYDTDADMAPAVKHAGAFFELAQRVPVTLPAYLMVRLPVADRRDANRFDRRNLPRGGRRRWDQYVLAAST